jgi:intracellular septation protein
VDPLAGLRSGLASARRVEAGAFLYAVRPIATDLGATFVFYLVLAVTGNVAAATLIGMVLGVTQLAVMKARHMPVAPMQWTSLALVIVMGGLTLITHDARFVLVKVSIVYGAIAATMLQPGWLYRYIPPIATDRVPRGLVVLFGFLWAALILGTGAINLALTFTVPATAVARFMLWWAPLSKVALFAVQYAVFRGVVRRRIVAELRAESPSPLVGEGGS